MSGYSNAGQEIESASALQQSVELICDLSRRLQLLEHLLAAAKEKRRLAHANVSEEGSIRARGSFIQ